MVSEKERKAIEEKERVGIRKARKKRIAEEKARRKRSS